MALPRIPKVHKLARIFGCTDEQAKAARNIWHAVTSRPAFRETLQRHVPSLFEQHSGPDDLWQTENRIPVALEALNALLGTRGVAQWYSEAGEWLATYLDVGDPEQRTLIDNGKGLTLCFGFANYKLPTTEEIEAFKRDLLSGKRRW